MVYIPFNIVDIVRKIVTCMITKKKSLEHLEMFVFRP